jgi:crotonobetainyl-CoA:carnitine CoA-transferase CaiB-like acyl-CoA transferase
MQLKNLKVIELSSVLAGPLVGTFFAELGAKVIKVEHKKTGGDVTRTWRLSDESPDNTVSAYYASANYGKECLFLDYSLNDDYQLLTELIKSADIVLVNFKPGDAEKFNLTYQDLKMLKPGFMAMNGEEGGLPLKMPLAMIDILAAHQLKEGILCALIERQFSGKGAHVKVSLFDAAVSSLANQAANFLMNNHIPRAIGSLHPNIAPYGELFQTADGHYIVLAVGSDKQFAQLCNAIDAQELLNDSKFVNNPQRVINRKELEAHLKPYFGRKSVAELEALLLQYAVPFGRVRNLKEVFELHKAKALIRRHVIEGQECITVKTICFSFD